MNATDYWVCRECDYRSRKLPIESIDCESWAVHCPDCGTVIDDRLERATDLIDKARDGELDPDEARERIGRILNE